MIYREYMQKLVIALIFLIATFSCTRSKLRPEFTGVDPKVQPIVKEYKWIGSKLNINFNKPVTIGFKHLTKKNVIATCWLTPVWREIEIDITYWNNLSPLSRTQTLFHELSHCYCSRLHTHDDGVSYPDTVKERDKEFMEWQGNKGPNPGFFEDDWCPNSLMFPQILSEPCISAHYNEYIKEMFNGCKPW